MYNPDGSVRALRGPTKTSAHVRAEAQLERVRPLRPVDRAAHRLSLQKELGRRLSGDGCETADAIVLFDLTASRT